jgi:uncharacterized protein (DUF433 family)
MQSSHRQLTIANLLPVNQKQSTQANIKPYEFTTSKPITVEQGKCGGRPCIRGQRIRVTDILELLGAGASVEEILADYEFLEREDILAAIDYAAYQTDHVVLQT